MAQEAWGRPPHLVFILTFPSISRCMPRSHAEGVPAAFSFEA
jgi:hypothetical protein